MNINVNEAAVTVTNVEESLTVGEKNIHTATVSFSPEYEEADIVAVFAPIKDLSKSIRVDIENGVCVIPQFKTPGYYELRVYAYKDGDIWLSPAPAVIRVKAGSYDEFSERAEQPSQSLFEKCLNNIKTQIPDISITDNGESSTLSVTDKSGTKSVEILSSASGAAGKDGADAYEIAVANGFNGSKSDWLASLKGETGATGPQGQPGADGFSPTVEVTHFVSQNSSGSSGNIVTITDKNGAHSFTVSNGLNGLNGYLGADGQDGASAYDIAVEHGFEGTQTEWLASLKGEKGEKGDSTSNPYPTDFKYETQTQIIPGESSTTITRENSSVGDIESAAAVSNMTMGTFWITDLDSYTVMRGKKLTSITLKTASAGILTVRGYSESLDKTAEPDALRTAAQRANANATDLFTINTQSGVATYLLDGTDSRVTLLNGLKEITAPVSLGLCKSGDTSTFYYNRSISSEYHNFVFDHDSAFPNYESLALDFTYEVQTEQTTPDEVVTNRRLKIEMSDGTSLCVNADVLSGDKYVTDATLNGKILSLGFNDKSSVNLDLAPLNNPLAGKKLSILGDSISTYQGYNPDGYAYWYPKSDITSADKTWWKQLVDETGMELVKNASWSGSYVTGDSASNSNALAACSNARINALADGATQPDIIVCFIGINDFGQSAHRGLGDYEGLSTVPAEGNITTLSEAYGLMMYKILRTYPGARLFCCSLMETSSANWDTGGAGVFPTVNNNGVSVSLFNARIKQLCENMGANFIDLHSCGINYWNLDAYTMDGLHPNFAGAKLIKDRIKSALLNEFK